MNRLVVTGIAMLMLLGISMHSGAQTRVTGHIFAEVVELTGAESRANAYVEIQSNSVSAEFDLGEISFHGKANTAFDVMVTSSDLVGSHGFEAPFQAQPDEFSSTTDATGKQVIRFSGTAGDDLLHATERQYAGNYQVVFSYN